MGHSFLVVSAGKADNVRMTSAGSGAWGELADSYLGLGDSGPSVGAKVRWWGVGFGSHVKCMLPGESFSVSRN